MNLSFLTFVIFILFSTQQIIVDTEYGKVKGTEKESHFEYRGIPFALAPVGDLRFEPTQPAKPWSPNVLNATKNPPGCPQRCFLPPGTCPDEVSEDCLFLNIFASKREGRELLPVLVYIHGGNFIQGNPASSMFEGGIFAVKAKSVVVMISYRLGALGFLFDDTNKITGNFGVLDQREAMRFVKRNIENFGGDPEKITIGGQSAGGSSVCAHLVAKKSHEYYNKAIIESNPFTIPWKRKHSAIATARLFYKNITCSDLSCLKTKSIDAILTAQQVSGANVNLTEFLHTFMAWTPVVDGIEITQLFVDAARSGNFKKTPTLFGTTGHETNIFIQRGFKEPLNDLNYIGLINMIFGKHMFDVLTFYPPYPSGVDKRAILTDLGSDYIFLGVHRLVMDQFNKHNPKDGTFYFHFNRSMTYDGWGPGYPYCRPLACHGINVPFLFQSLPEFTPSELELSNEMIIYYGNFIRTGDPNGGLTRPKVIWPKYNLQSKQHIQFENPRSRVGSHLAESKCNFWDRLGYTFGGG